MVSDDGPGNVVPFRPRTGPGGHERYLTKAELADLLGVSVAWVNKHMRESALPCQRFAGAVRFRLSDVQRWAGELSEVPRGDGERGERRGR